MVNVTHNAYDGGALCELLLGVLGLVEESFLNADYNLGGCGNAEFIGNQRRGIKIHGLVYGYHHAHEHQLLNYFSGSYVKLGSQLSHYDLLGKLYRRGLVDNNGRGSCFHSLLALALGVLFAAEGILTTLLLFQLLCSAAEILIAVGNEIIQSFIVLGEIHRRGMGINYARTLEGTVWVDVGGSASYNRLRLELLSWYVGNVITLIAAVEAVVVAAAVLFVVKKRIFYK